jgi:biopolymer transport protein ExbB/TolQ
MAIDTQSVVNQNAWALLLALGLVVALALVFVSIPLARRYAAWSRWRADLRRWERDSREQARRVEEYRQSRSAAPEPPQERDIWAQAYHEQSLLSKRRSAAARGRGRSGL